MRVLITGVTGFVGRHLAAALAPTDDVVGVSRRGGWPVDTAPELTRTVRLVQADLCARERLVEILREVQPEAIYHLAGYANPSASLQHAEAAWRDNLTATFTLYTAIHAWGGAPRILYVSSGLVYGDPRTAGEVFHEDSPFYPLQPYGSSKAAADVLSYQVCRHPGLHVMRVRPYNHFGPGQAPEYAIASFARQIAAIEGGRQPPILETGNLRASRDLTDVRDVVAAYRLALTAGKPGEAYNVASENVVSMADIVTQLAGLASVQIEVREKAQLVRASESLTLRASAAKIRTQLGWAPRYSHEQTLRDTLSYWRERLRGAN